MVLMNKLVLLFILLSQLFSIQLDQSDLKYLCGQVTEVEDHPILGITLQQQPKDGGAYGKIYFTVDPWTGSEVALKAIKIEEDFILPLAINEITILRMMRGRFDMMSIPMQNGCYYDSDTVYIIMPKAKVDLGMLLAFSSRDQNEPYVRSYVWKAYITNFLVNIVCNLHDLNVLHLDIKADNFLLKDFFNPVLTDFGLSNGVDPISEYDPFPTYTENRYLGTEGFMAEEIKTGTYYRQTDIFALGITIMQIWFIKSNEQYESFNGLTVVSIIQMCQQIDNLDKETNEYYFCKFYYDIVSKMTNKYYNKRPLGQALKQMIGDATTRLIQQIAKDYTQLQYDSKNQSPASSNVDYSFNLHNRDIRWFMEEFIKSKREEMNSNRSYMEFMLGINAPIFRAYKDKGIKLLGFSIDAFLSGTVLDDVQIPPIISPQHLVI